jgi:hypothetical protein
MFVVPYVMMQCYNWKDKKKKIIELCSSQHMAFDMMLTDFFENNEGQKYCESVYELFENEIDAFRNELKISNKMKIHQAWFEISEKGMYHTVHNHGALGYSAVCYLEYFPELHIATTFVAPYNNFLTGNQLEFTPKVDEGTIIFFPSVISHYVIPNKSEVARKVVSFNLHGA